MHPETQARRAGIYGRESEGDPGSIRDQLAGGRRAATELGWPVVDEYQDPVSASRFARKRREMWARLLADLESGRINAVIVKDASRAERDPEYWFPFLSLCRRKQALIFSVIEDYIYDVRKRRDWKTLADEGVRNADESEKISERQVVAHDDAYRRGNPSGGDCPYGYKRERIPRKDNPKKYDVKQLENPETAEVVRWIFKEIAGGTPLRRVLKDLNRRGVLSPRGVEGWQHGRLRGIITSPVYIGMRRHNGSPWVKGNWPALVDEEEWYAANRILEANRAEREGDRPARLEHWLSGVIKCGCSNVEHEHLGPDGVCGGDVCGRGAREGRSAKYGCREYGCVSVLVATTDEYIFDKLFERFEDPEYVPSLLRQAQRGSADAAAASAEVERLLGEKRHWEARYESEADRDLAETILLKIKAINTRIAAARKRAAEVTVPASLRVLFGETFDWDATALTFTVPDEDSLPAFLKWGRPDAPSLSPEAVERYGRMIRDPEFKRAVDLVARFASLSIPARRAVIRDLMEVKLYPSGKGVRLPIEQRLSVRFK